MKATRPERGDAGYQDRVKAQTLAWAQGRPYHNSVDDECAPDFSCCNPGMFERDEAKRWQHYRDFHGELHLLSRAEGENGGDGGRERSSSQRSNGGASAPRGAQTRQHGDVDDSDIPF